MNKKLKVVLIVGLLAVTTVYAGGNEPGTSNDPLVTKSYVDKKVAEISSTSGGGTSSTYTVVAVPEGKMIFGKQGTEIILRAGEATVISAEAGGVQDMTAGADINGGSQAPKYHLLIVPREDGRGLLANKTLTVMVRGGYVIQ